MTVPVLVVDANREFGILIRQSLEEGGRYQVTLAASGLEAIQRAQEDRFGLAIIDFALPDSSPVELINRLRQIHQGLTVIAIPVSHEALDPELNEVRVEGILTKPFYLPHLPDILAEAMQSPSPAARSRPPVAPPAAAPASPAPAPEQPAALETQAPRTEATPPWLADVDRATAYLSRLTPETSAQAALLTREDRLWAYAGELARSQVQELTSTVAGYWAEEDDARGAVAQFIQLPGSSKDYFLYATEVVGDFVLSLIYDAQAPFGTVRRQAKSLVRTLMATDPSEHTSETPQEATAPAPAGLATQAPAEPAKPPPSELATQAPAEPAKPPPPELATQTPAEPAKPPPPELETQAPAEAAPVREPVTPAPPGPAKPAPPEPAKPPPSELETQAPAEAAPVREPATPAPPEPAKPPPSELETQASAEAAPVREPAAPAPPEPAKPPPSELETQAPAERATPAPAEPATQAPPRPAVPAAPKPTTSSPEAEPAAVKRQPEQAHRPRAGILPADWVPSEASYLSGSPLLRQLESPAVPAPPDLSPPPELATPPPAAKPPPVEQHGGHATEPRAGILPADWVPSEASYQTGSPLLSELESPDAPAPPDLSPPPELATPPPAAKPPAGILPADWVPTEASYRSGSPLLSQLESPPFPAPSAPDESTPAADHNDRSAATQVPLPRDWLPGHSQQGSPIPFLDSDPDPGDTTVAPAEAQTEAKQVFNLVLAPEKPQQLLRGPLAETLEFWVMELCQSWAWRLDRLIVKPEYLQVQVRLPKPGPVESAARRLHRELGTRFAQAFPEHDEGRKGRSFWAKPFLLTTDRPPDEASIQHFLRHAPRGRTD